MKSKKILWVAAYWNGNRETWDVFAAEEDYEAAKKSFFEFYKDEYGDELDAEDFYDVYPITDVGCFRVKLVPVRDVKTV